MTIPWHRLILGATSIVVVAIVVLTVGLVPIQASSGHWPVTEWFLSSVMKRSVAFQSRNVEVPRFEPGLEVLGAGYYEHGCRRCHGKPGGAVPVALQAATPHPPPLGRTAEEYTAAELYTIIKDGIKFTGMPAWPRLTRDDEVWSVVAMLQKVNGKGEQAYDQLLWDGSRAEGPPFLQLRCAPCHGATGEGRGPTSMPSLAGQDRRYLEASLRAFAERQRFSGIMEPIAAAMTESEIEAAADFYAAQQLAPPSGVGSSDEAEDYGLGEQLALQGDMQRRIPACNDCHRRDSRTSRQVTGGQGPAPILHGQRAQYLLGQLELFSKRERGGSPYAELMHKVRVNELSQEEQAALAAYFSQTPFPTDDVGKP